MLTGEGRREEFTVTGKTESLVVLVALLIIENLDDLLALAADHHRIILRVHMYRPSAALEKLRTFILGFEHGGKVGSLRA